MQQETPAVPIVPTLAPGQVTVDGTTLSSPSAVYQAYRAQRRELGRQLETLEDTREQLSSRLVEQPSVTGADRRGLEQRISSLDGRITVLDKQIADADALVARTAAIPGAAVDPPEPIRQGPPDEFYVLTGMFIVIVFLPLSIAFARRIWRRGAQVVTSIPRELSERLMRVEQTVEASALEIERIGEGQRFMTRVLTEGGGAGALSVGGAQAARIPAHRQGDARP